jgi:hypothetical protein
MCRETYVTHNYLLWLAQFFGLSLALHQYPPPRWPHRVLVLYRVFTYGVFIAARHSQNYDSNMQAIRGNNYRHSPKTAVSHMARSTHTANLISVPRIFHLLHKTQRASFTDTPVQRTRYHIEGFASPTVFPSQPSLYCLELHSH